MNSSELAQVMSSVIISMGVLFAIVLAMRWMRVREKESKSQEGEVKSSGLGSGGYIILDLPERHKPLFHDLLKGFEDYAKLNGYSIRFSVDNSLTDKIAFKFTVGDPGVAVDSDRVKRDLKDYIKKVQEDAPLDDLPVVLPIAEHQLLITTMKNRINFLHHSYQSQKNITELYESIIKDISKKGLGLAPSQNFFIQGGGSMSGDRYTAKDSQQVAQGTGSKLIDTKIDQSIRIAESFNERKAQLELISKLMESLTEKEGIDKDSKDEALKYLRKVKEELADEESPNPSRIKKWLDKAKNVLGLLKAGDEIIVQAKQVFESFNLSL